MPWTASIPSIPVIWARGQNEELYVFVKTGMALPVHETGLLQSFIENLNLKYFLYIIENNYIAPTQKMIYKSIPKAETTMVNLYSSVQLVLWGADPILRVNSALLTPLVAEVHLLLLYNLKSKIMLFIKLNENYSNFRLDAIIAVELNLYQLIFKKN